MLIFVFCRSKYFCLWFELFIYLCLCKYSLSSEWICAVDTFSTTTRLWIKTYTFQHLFILRWWTETRFQYSPSWKNIVSKVEVLAYLPIVLVAVYSKGFHLKLSKDYNFDKLLCPFRCTQPRHKLVVCIYYSEQHHTDCSLIN